LNEPKAISLTESGDLLIADEQNNRIRFVGTVAIPRNVTPPAVSGDAALGRQLTAFAGGWRGTGPLISYQWQRCNLGCENVPGATAKLYRPTAADNGARLRVAVTASNPAGSVTVASPPTTTITASSAPNPSSPSPRGAAPAGGDASPNVPKPGTVNWLVQASRTFQRAAEYTVRGRNTRLADAINAYGKPSCRVMSRKHVVATWVNRGIRIDSLTNRALPAARTGCSSPTLIHVSEIRLTDRRWVTSLGLRVGDTTSKLRRLYPRSPYARARRGSSRNEYYLVWRHERCRGSCSPQARRQGVNHPLLTAQVANGKVVALWIPVFGQLR
jgi:hypothetical protein